jgi:uncharacterized protein (TIRG00374 family)
MNRVRRPSFIIPFILSAVLIFAILAFGDFKKVEALISTFQPSYVITIVLLTVAYEAVQCVQWIWLVRALGIRVPVRSMSFAFLIGESTKILPIGNYVENYILLREEGTDFGLSSAATLMSVLIEVAVTLTTVVALGIRGWDWLRPLVLIGLAVFLCGAWLISRFHPHVRRAVPGWVKRHQTVQALLREVHQFREGSLELLHLRVLAPAAVLSLGYLLLGGTTLYFILRGLGVDDVAWHTVLAVYVFSVAFSLISPLPVDIGVSEASGVGAFLAVGVDKTAAVSAVLILRAVTTGVSLVIALLTILVMSDRFRAVLRSRPHDARGDRSSNGDPAADLPH